MTENREAFDLARFATQRAERQHTSQTETSTPSTLSFTLVAETSSRSIMDSTSLQQNGQHSGDFGFDDKDPSLRVSSAENSQEPTGNPKLPTGQPTTSTYTLGALSWKLLTILVAVASVLVWKNYPIVDSDLSFPQSDRCYNQSPVDFMNGLSFPCQINLAAHEAVLNELRDSETLEILVHTWSRVHSSLKMTETHLTSRFACAIKEYSSSNNKRVFLNQINITQAQLDSIVLNVSELSDLYHSIKPAYYELESAAAKAVQAVQLQDRHQYAIKAQPWIFRMIGLDTEKSFWDLWIAKSKKWEEAQSGLIALRGEIQQLKQIAEVVQTVVRRLKQLEQEVQEGREKAVESGESRRQWFKQWFLQNIIRHIEQDGETLTDSKFDSWWEKLCSKTRA